MTPFGMMLRQERKEKGLMLATMARDLGMSSPYLSQIETGAKPIKEAFVNKVIAYFDLNKSDADALRRAAAKSLPANVGTVTIELTADTSARDRELASNLALSFNRLKPEAKARLREMLEDETNG